MPQIKGHGLLTHLKDNQPKWKLILLPMIPISQLPQNTSKESHYRHYGWSSKESWKRRDWRKSPYTVQIQENTDQKNSEFGHFSRSKLQSDKQLVFLQVDKGTALLLSSLTVKSI